MRASTTDAVPIKTLSANPLAQALGVTAARVNDIAREWRGITEDTALRLARYFGTDAASWMNLQQHYEMECAQDARAGALEKIRPRIQMA